MSLSPSVVVFERCTTRMAIMAGGSWLPLKQGELPCFLLTFKTITGGDESPIFDGTVFFFLFVCMWCLYILVHMCMHVVGVHTCLGGQRSTSGVFSFSMILSYFLRQGLSLILESIDSLAWLTSKPCVCHLQDWGCMCSSPRPAFMWVPENSGP